MKRLLYPEERTSPTTEIDGDFRAATSGDLRLMQLVAGGNSGAQKQLVLRLSGRIQRVCQSLSNNAAEVDDATQQTLMELLKSAHRYQGRSTVESWAYRIAVRTMLRVKRSRVRAEAQLATDVEPDDLTAGDGQATTSESIPRTMQSYLNELPEELRTLVVLRHVYEYTIPEIAELTQTSPNTTKKRLMRANQEMRRMIRRESLATGSAGSATHEAGGHESS